MGTLSTTAVTTLMDSVASTAMIFDAALGTSSSQANTAAKAAANDVATITSVSDNDVQSDLASWYRSRARTVLSTSLYSMLGYYNIWVALERHLATTGVADVTGLDSFLRYNNIRVSPLCKAVGFPLSAEQLMPPQVDPMGTFSVSGPGSGSFISVANVDTSQYGRAWLELVVTSSSGLGGSPISATVYGLQFDQTTPTTLTATMAAGSSYGATVAVGSLGVQADSYDSVTNITITGGSAGDAFKVRSRVERTITATA